MENKEPIRVPKGLTLKPFQEDAVRLMLKFLQASGGCYNAYEMGLGKTVQAIVATNNILQFQSNIPTILVICPAVMLLTWRREIKLWSKGYKFNWIIKSYNHVSSNIDDFAKTKFDVLILDEAHYLKNSKAQRTKNILKKIWDNCKYKICLSGTPFTNNIVDGYTLFHRLNPTAFPDWWTFANRYAERKNNGFGFQFVGLRNEEELRKIIWDSFFLRKTKKQVLPELPDKVYQRISLDEKLAHRLTKEEEIMMEEYRKELIALLQSDTPMKSIKPPPVAIMKIRREQGLKKVKPVVEYLKILLEQNVPLVVFCVFTDVLEQLVSELKAYNPVVLQGSTTLRNRQRAIDDFQSGKSNLFLGQIDAAGIGITLVRSSNVVLPETCYSPNQIQQAVDRLHRIGQKDCVTVHYFVVENSVDEKINDSLMKKANNFHKVLKEPNAQEKRAS